MSGMESNPIFTNADKAREYLEAQRWPNGPWCPHCGNADPDRIAAVATASARPGLYNCKDCRKQFTVTVGTVYERSHIPLNTWLLATFLLCSSKKGMSTRQFHRMLGVSSLKTAWFMVHRIRKSMEQEAFSAPLGGSGKVVEADELYIGKREGPIKHSRKRINWKPTKGGKSGPAQKRVVIGLVERGGEVRTFHIEHATKESVRDVVVRNVSRESALHTDESKLYTAMGKEFDSHRTVKHSAGEYVRYEPGPMVRGEAVDNVQFIEHGPSIMVTTNTIENVFSVMRRGMHGVYQHCGEAHLHRYLAEFAFRHNNRSALGIEDMERTNKALRGIEGKRLMYRRPAETAHA